MRKRIASCSASKSRMYCPNPLQCSRTSCPRSSAGHVAASSNRPVGAVSATPPREHLHPPGGRSPRSRPFTIDSRLFASRGMALSDTPIGTQNDRREGATAAAPTNHFHIGKSAFSCIYLADPTCAPIFNSWTWPTIRHSDNRRLPFARNATVVSFTQKIANPGPICRFAEELENSFYCQTPQQLFLRTLTSISRAINQ